MACRECGVGASDISDTARKRHYSRYARVSSLVEPFVRTKDLVVDAGSGSGYGTKMLTDRFHKVIGIEPNDVARRYAAHHYKNCVFANDAPPGDVVVMVEVIEHLSNGEFKSYVPKAHTVAITTPILAHAWNEFHEKNWKSHQDVTTYLRHYGFEPIQIMVDTGITFTTNEQGSNLIAVYRRAD